MVTHAVSTTAVFATARPVPVSGPFFFLKMHGSMEFEDVATANSGSTVAIMGHKKKKGCWVGPWAIAGIILLTALLVMIVALMVFYLHPDRKSGGSEETTSGTPCRS